MFIIILPSLYVKLSNSRHGQFFQNLLDHGLCGGALRALLVLEDEPVREHRPREFLRVVGDDELPSARVFNVN